MKRILFTAVLAFAAVLSTGCAGSAIKAEAPGGTAGQTGTVPSSGSYTLYHVTKFDRWGAPETTEKVITVDLRANDRVGFQYVLPKEKQYMQDAHSEVVAFAGATFRQNLGPITTLDDHYYWCSPNDWDSFWALRPERVVAAKAMQY